MSPTWAAVTDPQPRGAAFDIVLLAHVACVVIGGGAVVVSAVQARRLGRVTDPSSVPDGLRTYYAPGANVAPRVLFGVPVFGLALLAMSHGVYRLGQGWVLSGLGLWLVAAGVAESVLWPAEHRLADELRGWAATDRPPDDAAAPVGPDPTTWPSRCRAVTRPALGVLAVLVLATGLMVVRP